MRNQVAQWGRLGVTGEAIFSYRPPLPHNNSPANLLFPIFSIRLVLLSCPPNLSLACWGLLTAPLWGITAPFHAPVPRGGEGRDQSGSFLTFFASQLLTITTNEMLEDFGCMFYFRGVLQPCAMGWKGAAKWFLESLRRRS